MPQRNMMTDYGFQKVSIPEKRQKIRNLFETVVPNYDLMNTLMSLGLHRFWKKKLVDQLPLGYAPCHILDVASGTADIGELIMKRIQSIGNASCQLTFCDLSEGMLQKGRKKIEAKAAETFCLPQNHWVCATAESIPLPNNSVDIYTVSFGLRNIADRTKALEEAYRVLKPGGTYFCLEFSHPEGPILQHFYDFYSKYYIPRLGALISKNRFAYQYLVDSIKQFPSQKILSYMIENAGFQNVSFQNILQGIVSIHRGHKY